MTKEEVPALKVEANEKIKEGDPEPSPDPTKIKVQENDDTKLLQEGELTEEDLHLKLLLEAAVHRLAVLTGVKSTVVAVIENTSSNDPSKEYELSLQSLRREIQSATSSLTSVPKPLKFLKPHFGTIKEVYSKLDDSSLFKKALADIISVLAMTMGSDNELECLNFKLKGNPLDLADWGHEYIRAISGEIGKEYATRVEKAALEQQQSEPFSDDLIALVNVIVPFQIKHNSETEAVDLLIEMEKLDWLCLAEKALVDEHNYARIALYLVRYADYVGDLEELTKVLHVAYNVYFSQKQFPDALRVAIRLNDMKRMRKAVRSARANDAAQLKQMGFILGAHRVFAFGKPGFASSGENEEDVDDNEMEVDDEAENDDIKELVGNNGLWEHFQSIARESNVEEPKTPEDVYKSHLSETSGLRSDATQLESARANLASTFVNAFVNCGFQKNLLMLPENSKWLFKNKDHGMTSAAASLGMLSFWNVDEGMVVIDKLLYSENDHVRAGALLGFGLSNCGVRDESDPAFAVLRPYADSKKDNKTNSPWTRICACLGLGIAYSGNPNSDIAETLIPVVQDSSALADMEVVSMAGLALGLAYAGTGNEEVTTRILQRLMEASNAELDQAITRHLVLGLAFCFLGKQDEADGMIEALQTIEHPIGLFAVTIVEGCACAGSGNVLKVQKMLHICAEHPEDELKKNSDQANAAVAATNVEGTAAGAGTSVPPAAAAAAAGAATGATNNDEEEADDEVDATKKNKTVPYQSAAVISLALITMSESIGSQMVERTYKHLLQYGDISVRRGVALAMGLSHVSDPNYDVVDILSKLSHDPDLDVAMCAIFSLGLAGAGTNNSRIAGLLRQLASFYANQPNPLFIVRMGQAMLHSGKGLVTMAPLHSDRMLLSKTALSGILAVLFCGLDFTATLLDKFHIIMYCLACAIRPRMILTLDEELQPLQVNVRVGLAVEIVGQAGQPKTITGFQTHTTPALVSVSDRCELADQEKWKPMTNVLEGIVILRKNPGFQELQSSNESKKL